MPIPRGYTSQMRVLHSGGKQLATIQAASGGDAVVDIGASQASGPATVRYEPLVVEAALSDGSAGLLEWIAEAGKGSSRDISVTTLSLNGQPIHELSLAEAVITEAVLPAWDAASKDAAEIQVTITPTSSRRIVPGSAPATTAGQKGKRIISSGFRLQLDSLSNPRVRRVSPIKLSYSDRKANASMFDVEIVEAVPTSWLKWFDESVANGAVGQERSGTLEILSPDLVNVEGTVKLNQVGICRLAPSNAPSEEAAPSWTATLYCSDVRLDWR